MNEGIQEKRVEANIVQVYVGVGTNVDREKNLLLALDTLRQLFSNVEVSPIYDSEAIACEGPNFLNCVVSFQTEISLAKLRESLKDIEREQGAGTSSSKAFKPIDLDILIYGDLVGIHEGIELPRPELYFNAFVLRPIAELHADARDPKTSKTFSELWSAAGIEQALAEFELDRSTHSDIQKMYS